MKKPRVLVVGAGSGHIPQILEYATTSRVKGLEPAFEVAGLVTQSADLIRELRRVNHRVDAVFLASRDVHLREDQAALVLGLGMHAYSDKVVAGCHDTAAELLARASQAGVTFSGGSTMRFTHPIVDLSCEGCSEFVIRGGADPSSPYGGRDFYAVHVIDAAIAVAGQEGELLDVQVRGADCELRFRGANGDAVAVVRDSHPDGSEGFTVLAPPRLAGPVPLGFQYLFPLLHGWGESLRSNEPLLSVHDNLLLVDALEALRAARS